MTNTETMRLILSFYRFDMPLYKRERARAVKSKKKVLVGILKKYGKYTLLIMLCVNLIYLMKKAGVYITLEKAMRVVSVSTVAVILLMSLIIAYLLMREPERAMVTRNGIVSAPVAADKTEPAKAVEKPIAEVKPEIRYRMQIADFTCMPSEKKMTASFVRALKRELKKSGGADAAAFMKETPDYQAPVVLTGSITKSPDGYMIIVRAVDSSSSEVKILSRNSVTDMTGFSVTARKVAEEILRGEK